MLCYSVCACEHTGSEVLDVKEVNNQSGPCAVGYEVVALQALNQTHHTTDNYANSYIWQAWQDHTQRDKMRIVTIPA